MMRSWKILIENSPVPRRSCRISSDKARKLQGITACPQKHRQCSLSGTCIIINLERWKENFLPAELLLFKDELEEEVFGVSLRFGLILLDKFDIFSLNIFFSSSIFNQVHKLSWERTTVKNAVNWNHATPRTHKLDPSP